MKDLKKIEFSSSPEGIVIVQMDGKIFNLTESHHELLQKIAELISIQYPQAWKALGINYKSTEGNSWYNLYKKVSRFILCNMGKMDALSFDVDNNILHIEDISCPIRRECQFNGIICRPKALNLSKREEDVVRMMSHGMTYKEISASLNVGSSTIKNIIQNATKRLKLYSSKDLMKIAAAIL